MKRLTIRNSDRTISQPTDLKWAEALERLAEYEDTDLTPEEISRILDAYGRGMTLRAEVAERMEIVRDIATDRLRELAQAEKERRLVVLPCKAGTTVFYIGNGIVEETIVQLIVYIESKSASKLILQLFRYGMDDTVKTAGIGDFGKTVFFDKEAAEAALAQKGETP